jgi:hypothetical protein
MPKFSKNTIVIIFAVCLTTFFCFEILHAVEGEEDLSEGPVAYSNGLLTVDAKEIRPEDLMKEIGEKCGIKIVVLGEVFSEVPVSLKFQKMPARMGIERVLRMASIQNYIMHFENGNKSSRVVEIDLIGKKGGEKYLTEGASLKNKTRPSKRSTDRRKKGKTVKTAIDKDEAEKIQENFLNIMDEVLKTQLEGGEEPDPAEILKLFKEVVPEEMKDQIPPEVMEELERLEQ